MANIDTNEQVVQRKLSDEEEARFFETVCSKPCYICRRTPEEVKDHIFEEYVPEEDGPLMYAIDGGDGYVPICRRCKGLIEAVVLKDTEHWLGGYVESKMFDMLCEVIDALETKKKGMMNR